MIRQNLVKQSREIIRSHQAPNGAYVACPNFATYRYSWFRDGAFIAYAMDLSGEDESARRFHTWAARSVLRYSDRAARAIEKAKAGEPLGEDYLHTRYLLSGEAGNEKWPNFQLDGLGTWLWAVAEFQRRHPEPLPAEWVSAVELGARYLAALWQLPCYDLWEEHPNDLHPYTLAAIYAGLRAAEQLLAANERSVIIDGVPLSEIAAEIRRVVLNRGVREGQLVKSFRPDARGEGEAAPVVDASLLGIATPYRLLSPDDPTMLATVARIENDLHYPGGGVYRYRADTYYGGGEWVLLASWLGWYYVEAGDRDRARELCRWVEAQADEQGELPEQVSTHLLAPEYYEEWEARWGPVAKPLLWSHAMYLVLQTALSR